MIFCVPTYGRAGKISDFVANELPLLGDVYLFVRKGERTAYKRAYPHLETMLVPDSCTNIAETRQFLCNDMDAAVWAMVDDDISNFCIKEIPSKFGSVYKTGIAVARPYLSSIMDELNYLCKPNRVGVIGLPDRVTLARPHKSVSGLPVRQFIFLTRAAAKAARYTMPLLSDIDCCLHWLTQKDAVVYNHYHLGQSSPPTAKTAKKGGCGEYREKNPTYYIDGYRQLCKRWPGIVNAWVDDLGKLHKRIAWSKVKC